MSQCGNDGMVVYHDHDELSTSSATVVTIIIIIIITLHQPYSRFSLSVV